MRQSITGLQLYRSLVAFERVLDRLRRHLLRKIAALQVCPVSVAVGRPAFARSPQLSTQRVGDRLCDFVLNGNDVRQSAVEPAGPQMVPVRCADELSNHPEAIAVGPETTFQDIADAEYLGDPADILRPPLEGEG